MTFKTVLRLGAIISGHAIPFQEIPCVVPCGKGNRGGSWDTGIALIFRESEEIRFLELKYIYVHKSSIQSEIVMPQFSQTLVRLSL